MSLQYVLQDIWQFWLVNCDLFVLCGYQANQLYGMLIGDSVSQFRNYEHNIAVTGMTASDGLNKCPVCPKVCHFLGYFVCSLILSLYGLQLNPIKSEVIQFTATRGRAKVDDVTSVVVSNAIIQLVSSTRSRGVTLDRKLSFDDHVNNTCRSCYYHIRALRHIRESLPDEVAKTVACSVISSRLDYCNALLSGMSKSNFTKLQRVQNTLARVVLRRRKYEHISSALRELHWLPVQYRVTFKTAVLVHSIKNTGQPAYLRRLLQDYEPIRSLRSSTKNLICKTSAETVLASRGFRHSAVYV